MNTRINFDPHSFVDGESLVQTELFVFRGSKSTLSRRAPLPE